MRAALLVILLSGCAWGPPGPQRPWHEMPPASPGTYQMRYIPPAPIIQPRVVCVNTGYYTICQ